MSCVITYKGNQYSEQEFKKYFNSNTSEFIKEIANSKNVIDSFKNKIDAINYVFQQAPELESKSLNPLVEHKTAILNRGCDVSF